MLDDRKKKVLQAIVEEYINTAEPVSSNALTNNEGTKPLSRWSYIIKEIKTSKILENIENTP